MPPWKVNSEAVKIILPVPRAIICWPISRLITNCAFRLTSSTSSQKSSSCVAAGLRLMVPALFTRISGMMPSALSWSQNPFTALRSEKSTAWALNVRPRAVTAFSISLPDASSEALTPIILAPAPARASAMPKPIPRRHPVTRAVFPARLN